MCGVFGYIGERDALQVCLQGLAHLEYRGYDSTGIAGIKDGKIVFCKKAGKLSQLKQTIALHSLEVAIAHTRWATHGKVSDQNAHPHFDSAQNIAVIHNGIIENYDSLRENLKKEGVRFSSETDTEVIAHLLAKHYQGDLVQALHQVLKFLQGIFAIVAIHKDHPNLIAAARRDCPLTLATDDKKSESIISSDPNTLIGRDYDVLFLRDGEIAKIEKGKIDIFDSKLQIVSKTPVRIQGVASGPSKEGFDHFMLKEIFEQPSTFQKAILGRLEKGIVFDELLLPVQIFKEAAKIWFIGCGTSAHAGYIGSLLLEDLSFFPSFCDIASEARYRKSLMTKDALVIAISQSGETADTLAALREVKKQGCKTLALCNVKNSTLAREADGVIFLQAGPEMSVCSTKAFTSQIAVLTLFSLFMGGMKKKTSKETVDHYVKEIKDMPSKIQWVLDEAPKIEKMAKKYSPFDDFFFMGRRYMFPTCLEAALKLKEISYVNANGYPAGELKHGPIALLDTKFPVIAFLANQLTVEKTMSNLMEVKARGAPVLAIAPKSLSSVESIVDDVLWVPDTLDELAPFPSSIVGQLFAYYFAKERGCDIDQPRNLAKSVTVE